MGDQAPLSLDATARLSGLPVEVLRGLIVRGQLPASRDPESHTWMIDPDDLRRYVERR